MPPYLTQHHICLYEEVRGKKHDVYQKFKSPCLTLHPPPYRQDYIDLLKVLEKRMRMWVRVTDAQEAGLLKLVGETFKKGKALDCGFLFEHHIDDYVHFIDPEW